MTGEKYHNAIQMDWVFDLEVDSRDFIALNLNHPSPASIMQFYKSCHL